MVRLEVRVWSEGVSARTADGGSSLEITIWRFSVYDARRCQLTTKNVERARRDEMARCRFWQARRKKFISSGLEGRGFRELGLDLGPRLSSLGLRV